MKHIEVHIVKTPSDLEMAYTAGLLEGEGAPFFITCDSCKELISLEQEPSHVGGGHILLTHNGSTIACYPCVGLALSDIKE
jgi:hypothetical protein